MCQPVVALCALSTLTLSAVIVKQLAPSCTYMAEGNEIETNIPRGASLLQTLLLALALPIDTL